MVSCSVAFSLIVCQFYPGTQLAYFFNMVVNSLPRQLKIMIGRKFQRFNIAILATFSSAVCTFM